MTVRSASRAIRTIRSDRPIPGCDQASHAESGEKARSRTGPLSDLTSSVTVPAAGASGRGSSTGKSSSSVPTAAGSPSPVPTSSSRPSCEATASTLPSGEAAISRTRPSRPEARRRPSARTGGQLSDEPAAATAAAAESGGGPAGVSSVPAEPASARSCSGTPAPRQFFVAGSGTAGTGPSTAVGPVACPGTTGTGGATGPKAPSTGGRAARPGRSAISTASSPPASVTKAIRPVPPSIRGSRTRAPGWSAMARAGPSRWVSQYRLPRTHTALARPVVSRPARSTWAAAGTW